MTGEPAFTIVPGLWEPLAAVAGHSGAEGIDRLLLATNASVPGRSFHVAAHLVGAGFVPSADFAFTERQRHPFDEINVLIPNGGPFRYRYEVEGEIRIAEGPCSVFLPAGVEHRMEPIEGTGVFLCIKLDRTRP